MASQYEKRKKKEIDAVTPNYNKVAYDVFHDKKTGKFLKVVIEYDSEKGMAQVKEIKHLADNLARAIQETQKLFVNKLMGIKGE